MNDIEFPGGVWCVFRMGTDESVNPDEFYSREGKELPFNVDLTDAYSILTPEGARQWGWSEQDKIDQNNSSFAPLNRA